MEIETALLHVMDAQSRTRGIDAAIAAIADRQHGVVGRAQLRALGLGRGAIAHRLECGRLHPVHRGVFAVGHRRLSREGLWMAAVLASGPGAVLSHRSAAALWQFRGTARGRIDVTASRKLHPRPGLHLHCAVLPPDEVATANDIPVTTPPRTLLDLAGVLSRQALARAVNEAEVLRLTDPLSLAALLNRHPRRRGAAALRQVLDESRVGETITRSELEDRFLAFLAAEHLPRPAVNVRIDELEADCVWHDARLVAELDGYASHGTRSAFERDRARDRRLQAAGWRVIRVTWWHLAEQPGTLVRELRALLA